MEPQIKLMQSFTQAVIYKMESIEELDEYFTELAHKAVAMPTIILKDAATGENDELDLIARLRETFEMRATMDTWDVLTLWMSIECMVHGWLEWRNSPNAIRDNATLAKQQLHCFVLHTINKAVKVKVSCGD